MAYTACNTVDELGPDILYLARDRNRLGAMMAEDA